MDLQISDLDATVSRDRAAELLGVTPEYIRQLCKAGEVRGTVVTTTPRTTFHERKSGGKPKVWHCQGGRREWTEIVTIDLVVLAASRHLELYPHRRGGTRIATPEAILAALPSRCPRCGLLSDGLCEDCRHETETGHRRFYEEAG